MKRNHSDLRDSIYDPFTPFVVIYPTPVFILDIISKHVVSVRRSKAKSGTNSVKQIQQTLFWECRNTKVNRADSALGPHQLWAEKARCPNLAQESLGAGLAADIDAVMRVWEAVELRGRALGVSAHLLKVEPVANVQDGVEAGALADAVNAVAGRTPDGVFDSLARRTGVGIWVVVQSLTVGAEDLGNRVLVVEHDARKVTVDSIVDVGHVTLSVESRVLDSATSDDVAGNGERRRHIEASGLGNDVDVSASREELLESTIKHGGHILERLAHEASTNVKSAQVEAVLASLLEHEMRVSHSLVKGHGIGSS